MRMVMAATMAVRVASRVKVELKVRAVKDKAEVRAKVVRDREKNGRWVPHLCLHILPVRLHSQWRAWISTS